LVILVSVGFVAVYIHAQSLPEYQVIVNVENPVDSLTKDQVSQIFLKKVKQWNDGREVFPVDLTADAEVRESFSKGVHNRSVASIKSYWQRMIFSGREVPPPEKQTESDVMEYVASKAGAIGYIRASTGIGGPVKTLNVTD
jgi:ABC-type phosphate transport system substrate-binding protein